MKKALNFVLLLLMAVSAVAVPAVAMNEEFDIISQECEAVQKEASFLARNPSQVFEQLKKVSNYFSSGISSLFKKTETLANTYPEVAEKITDTFSSDAFECDNIFSEPKKNIDMLQVYKEVKQNLEPVAASIAQTYKSIEENAGPATDALVRGISRVYKNTEVIANDYPEVTAKVIDTFTSDAFECDNIFSEPKNQVDMLKVYTEVKANAQPVTDALVRGASHMYKSVEMAANNHPEVMKKVTDAFASGDFENDNILSNSMNLVSEVSEVPEVQEVVKTVVDNTSNAAGESLSAGIFGFFANKLQQLSGFATGAVESVKSFDKDTFIESCKQEPAKPIVIAGGVILGSYITYQLGKVAYKKALSAR